MAIKGVHCRPRMRVCKCSPASWVGFQSSMSMPCGSTILPDVRSRLSPSQMYRRRVHRRNFRLLESDPVEHQEHRSRLSGSIYLSGISCHLDSSYERHQSHSELSARFLLCHIRYAAEYLRHSSWCRGRCRERVYGRLSWWISIRRWSIWLVSGDETARKGFSLIVPSVSELPVVSLRVAVTGQWGQSMAWPLIKYSS